MKEQKECYVFGNFSTFNKEFAKGLTLIEFQLATKGIRVNNVEEVFVKLGGKMSTKKKSSGNK